jgi:hypothetical protein
VWRRTGGCGPRGHDERAQYGGGRRDDGADREGQGDAGRADLAGQVVGGDGGQDGDPECAAELMEDVSASELT